MNNEELELELDEIRERINDPQIHVDFLKKIRVSMDIHHPKRGAYNVVIEDLIAQLLNK